MKNILVLIHDDAGQEARLQAALDVTRAVKGHLSCLDVTMMQVVPGDPVEAGGAMVLAAERQQEAANKQRLERRLVAEDVSWDWIEATGFLEPCLEQAASLSDLIVVNRQLDKSAFPDMGHVASGLVVGSGKPVLAVPDFATGFKVGGAALVAWDGSREAAAAVGKAVPLLGLASDVTILEVEDGSIREPAEEAASYLSRHGIHPRIVRAKRFGDPASDVILAKANSGKFDYLVMGGFSHSRFVEALFGGVTRRLLIESPIPLFLAH